MNLKTEKEVAESEWKPIQQQPNIIELEKVKSNRVRKNDRSKSLITKLLTTLFNAG